MKIIALIILILVSEKSLSQSDNLHRFYDFGVEIDFHHLLFDDDFKIIFPNGFTKYNHLKENTLYRIKYTYDQEGNRKAVDTLKVTMNEEQMNKIFSLTIKQFNIGFEENLSKYEIPPPPPINDGMVANLVFDLQFRGDEYSKKLSFPFGDNTFMELFGFIEQLTNKN